jgi:tetratricopeptide (TPR) repeat protein
VTAGSFKKITLTNHVLFLVVWGCCLLASGASYAASPDLDSAQSLITQGRAAEAFSLLEPYEFVHAGDPQFDYLLGLAALESGEPAKATIILERVLAVDPNFLGARLDLARAHFVLGNRADAKVEFESLLAQNPPPAARATIARYLAAIDESEKSTRKSFVAYIEAGAGHDTNVNNATSQSTLVVPALVGAVFTLDPRNVKKGDNYASWTAGTSIDYEIHPTISLYAGGDVRNRVPQTQHDFGFLSVDGRIGLRLDRGGDTIKGGLLGGIFDLGNHLNRETLGTNGEWRHAINAQNQVNVFGQYVAYRFPDASLKANNYDQKIMGVGWLHIATSATTALFASIYGGNERALNNRADGNTQLIGVRVGYQGAPTQTIELLITAGARYGHYDTQNPAFFVNRIDKFFDATVALNWHLDNVWTLRPQIVVLRNNSNITINRFEGVDASVNLRRDFK